VIFSFDSLFAGRFDRKTTAPGPGSRSGALFLSAPVARKSVPLHNAVPGFSNELEKSTPNGTFVTNVPSVTLGIPPRRPMVYHRTGNTGSLKNWLMVERGFLVFDLGP
jgi:hypothetical protein